jgi:hypothetical protein
VARNLDEIDKERETYVLTGVSQLGHTCVDWVVGKLMSMPVAGVGLAPVCLGPCHRLSNPHGETIEQSANDLLGLGRAARLRGAAVATAERVHGLSARHHAHPSE